MATWCPSPLLPGDRQPCWPLRSRAWSLTCARCCRVRSIAAFIPAGRMRSARVTSPHRFGAVWLRPCCFGRVARLPFLNGRRAKGQFPVKQFPLPTSTELPSSDFAPERVSPAPCRDRPCLPAALFTSIRAVPRSCRQHPFAALGILPLRSLGTPCNGRALGGRARGSGLTYVIRRLRLP
jgi:hypothetical protein